MHVPLPQADIVSLRRKVHKGFLSYCGKRLQHGFGKINVPGVKTPYSFEDGYRSVKRCATQKRGALK
jgi:hypothetical protein